jgi:endonuclease G
MMPQNSTFNQGIWGQLEGKVRGAICADTLYVVVGTLFEDGQKFTSRGRTIARPSHCYKLLLRTKAGNTKKSISQITNADEIKAIGFLYENQASADKVEHRNAVVSIAEIEKRAGVTFFRNLNPAIAEKVKSQKNINDWSNF